MPLCQGGVGDASIRHVTELPLPYPTVTIHQLSPRYPMVAQETWYAVQQRNINNNIELKTSGKLLYMHIGQICGSSDACAAFLIERGSRSGTRFNRYLTQSDV